jgi:hypothetical protein
MPTFTYQCLYGYQLSYIYTTREIYRGWLIRASHPIKSDSVISEQHSYQVDYWSFFIGTGPIYLRINSQIHDFIYTNEFF